jgi:hypothetical protein
LEGWPARLVSVSRTNNDKGVLESGKKKTWFEMEENYPMRKSAYEFGANKLVNGQWYVAPSNICRYWILGFLMLVTGGPRGSVLYEMVRTEPLK